MYFILWSIYPWLVISGQKEIEMLKIIFTNMKTANIKYVYQHYPICMWFDIKSDDYLTLSSCPKLPVQKHTKRKEENFHFQLKLI